MSSNINSKRKDPGFTIVELLVVIVVIGILAAITIVSYTGVTNRANTVAAQTAANNVARKAEVYFSDGPTSKYPARLSDLTSATTDKTYYLSGVTFDGTILSSSNLPTKNSEINFFRCGTGTGDPAPANLAAITDVSGARVGYWNYNAQPAAIAYNDIGKVSGTVGTKNVACFITTTENES